jgi:hypothetical protein
MEAVDGSVLRYVASFPNVAPVRKGRLDHFQTQTVRIRECDPGFAEAFGQNLARNPMRSKPVAPVLTGTGRNRKGSRSNWLLPMRPWRAPRHTKKVRIVPRWPLPSP